MKESPITPSLSTPSLSTSSISTSSLEGRAVVGSAGVGSGSAISFLAIALALILFSSCEHKPLYVFEETPRPVRLIFDWEYLRAGEAIPEGMHVAFRPDIVGVAPDYQYEVPTSTGLLTAIQPMEYTITGYSNDIPEIVAIPYNDDVLIKTLEPDADVPSVYAFSQKELIENTATDNILAMDERPGEAPSAEQVIVAKPSPVNTVYTIRVLNADCVEGDADWTATLSGLADAILLGSGRSAEAGYGTPVVRRLPLASSETPTERRGMMSLFGRYEGEPNVLKLRITRHNGLSSFFTIDVTSQIEKAPDPHNVVITVNLRDYEEEYEEGGGALTPAVDEFPESEQEITM